MKALADPRGLAIIFERKAELEWVRDRVTEMLEDDRERPLEWPAVLTFSSPALPSEAQAELHQQAWWMGMAVQPTRARTDT